MLYTLLYIEKKQKQTWKGRAKGQTNQEEREPGQRLDSLPSFPPRPRSLPSDGEVGQGKRPTRKRENQGEGFRRPLRPFLASILFRLLSSPSAPSPAAQHITTVAPATRARGRAATPSGSGRCYRHHIATDRPQQANSRAAPRAVGHPARLVLVLVRSFRW